MPACLGLDLSKTRSAWAMDGPDGRPRCGSWPFGGYSLGKLITSYQGLLYDQCKMFGVEAVAYEAPILKGGRKGDGGDFVQVDAIALIQFGMAAATEAIAFSLGVPVYKVKPDEARKAFIGERFPKDPKQVVMAHCQRLGWEPMNTDESDACAVWAWVKGRTAHGIDDDAAATPLLQGMR